MRLAVSLSQQVKPPVPDFTTPVPPQFIDILDDQRHGLDGVARRQGRRRSAGDGWLHLFHHADADPLEPQEIPFRHHPSVAGGFLPGMGQG